MGGEFFFSFFSLCLNYLAFGTAHRGASREPRGATGDSAETLRQRLVTEARRCGGGGGVGRLPASAPGMTRSGGGEGPEEKLPPEEQKKEDELAQGRVSPPRHTRQN